MHRREFIAALAGTVTGAHSLTLPAASAQQAAKVRRIGVLMGTSESTSRGLVDAFLEEMARLGWADGRNARFEQRQMGMSIARVLSQRSWSQRSLTLFSHRPRR
jgi:hypothetical protein